MTDFFEEIIEEESLFKGRIFEVRRASVRLSDGSEGTRELVDHAGGVAILAVDAAGDCFLVKQYRLAVQENLLELPAGKLEKDEDPLGAAQRELKEECGVEAASWRLLARMYPSPGYLNEVLHLYLATDLSFGESALDEGELLHVEKRPFQSLMQAIKDGEIMDAKTCLAAYTYQALLQERSCL